jgi:hypothetical protein
MKMKLWILSLIVVTLLLVPMVDAKFGNTVDDSKKASAILENVPADMRGKIAVAGGDNSYSVSREQEYIAISKAETKGKHTKTKLTIDKSVLGTLNGYNGKEFRFVRVVDGKIVDSKLIKTKDVLKGKTITLDATFSEVIISGVVGSYTKTVQNVDMLNTSIPFDVTNASYLTINITSPGTYEAWDEYDLATYPGTSGKWLFIWPLNGSSVIDISGNSRTGTLSGTTSIADRLGTSSRARSFDGTDDYLYYNYVDTLYSNLEYVLLYNLSTTSQYCVGDFRDPSAVGRTAMYTTETAWYIDNGTVQNQAMTSSLNRWSWAFYPFASGQINYVWTGTRYSGTYDLTGKLDLVALYNGTLSANDRRKFTYGYEGITIATNLNESRIPVTSASQSLNVSGNLTGVSVKSNTAGTKNITLSAIFTHDYLMSNEYDNGTHHIVEILYTPTSNIMSGTLNYTLASIEELGSPVIESNDTSAAVQLVGNTLVVTVGEISEGVTKSYNISMTSGDFEIIGYGPLDTTPTKTKTGTQLFNVTVNGSTVINWYVNDSLAESDVGSTGNYTYSGSIAGDYNITADVGSDSQSWILTVLPDALSDYDPDSLSLKIRNGTIQQFKTMYTYDESPQWILNNVTVGNDTNVTTSAYWFNGSDVGIYNVTAKIDESQVVWTVNVTATPKTGLGEFVEETIMTAVVIVAAGYFWNRFRRRTF